MAAYPVGATVFPEDVTAHPEDGALHLEGATTVHLLSDLKSVTESVFLRGKVPGWDSANDRLLARAR